MNKYLFFGLIISGLFITFRITERQKKESGSNGGCFYYGFMTLVYESLLLLSIGALALAGTGLYRNIINTSYQATIVGQEEYLSEDDEGGSHLMHTPIVEFIPNGQNIAIRAKLDISSGGEYKIGESHRIVYNSKTGEVNSGSTSTILLQLGGLLMGLFLLSFVVYGFLYAFYLPTPFNLADIIKVGFVYTFMPIGMIGMDLALIYYVYQRLILDERTNEPIWPLAISIFFSLVLTLTIYWFGSQFIKSGKFKHLFVKKR